MIVVVITLAVCKVEQLQLGVLKQSLKGRIFREKDIKYFFIFSPHLVGFLVALLHGKVFQMRHVFKTLFRSFTRANKEFT